MGPQPLRVLHIVTTLSAGGAELHLLSLCREQQRRGVLPAVAFLREHVRGSRSLREDFAASGIPVHDLGGNQRLGIGWVRRLFAVLEEEQPHLLHTHLPRADFSGAVARTFRRSLVWVSSLHSVDPYRRSVAGRTALRLVRPMWHRADAVIAISGRVRSWAIDTLGIPDDKVTTVSYGLDIHRFETSRPDFADGRSPVVTTIGRLEPSKGHQYLIRALKLVHEHHPATRLRIIGHDPNDYSRKLQSLADRLGVAGRVEILGFRRDIPELLAHSDLFAFASETEGFGLVLIEAMAAGCPVVASRIEPLTDIAQHGRTGLLVEPRDPRALAEGMVRLLSNPDLAAEMGERGRERVRSFYTVEVMTRRTLDVYRGVCTMPEFAGSEGTGK